MHLRNGHGPITNMRVLLTVLTMLCLGLAFADPVTERIVLVDQAPVGQDLKDLLFIIQEEEGGIG